MSAGGGGKGGGGAKQDKGLANQAGDAWDMTQQRYDLQNQILNQFLDPWMNGQETDMTNQPDAMKYSNPFWWDQM